jgi:hypothetical protein
VNALTLHNNFHSSVLQWPCSAYNYWYNILIINIPTLICCCDIHSETLKPYYATEVSKSTYKANGLWSCVAHGLNKWFYKVNSLFWTVIFTSIINQQLTNNVDSHGHINQFVEYYTLNLCGLTSLLWQLLYMRKYNTNARLPLATSLPLKTEDMFPRGYVPQLTL